jgi:hypothetical protein
LIRPCSIKEAASIEAMSREGMLQPKLFITLFHVRDRGRRRDEGGEMKEVSPNLSGGNLKAALLRLRVLVAGAPNPVLL